METVLQPERLSLTGC